MERDQYRPEATSIDGKDSKRKICIILIILAPANIYAELQFKFGWNIGDIGYSMTNKKRAVDAAMIANEYKYSNSEDLLQLPSYENETFLDINIANFYLIEDNTGLGIHIRGGEIQLSYDNPIKYSVLPLELTYRPIKFSDLFHVSLYWCETWPLGSNNEFKSSVGIRFSMIVSSSRELLYYIPFNWNIFIEYTSPKTIRMGIYMDFIDGNQ
jgi:hypothetical protein